MGFWQRIFGKLKTFRESTSFEERGSYRATYTSFGNQIYKSEIVRSCVRPLAEHTSKASPKSSDKNLERILTYCPNYFMNGKDFLSKCRNILEVKNTLFVLITRDDKGKAVGFYPVPYERYEALEYNNGLYIKFKFKNPNASDLTASWDDLAVARKDYLFSDISGEKEDALLPLLDIVNTTNQGISHAVKATTNLRGIIKLTKAILDEDDVKESRDRFVRDYMGLENSGGIAALDPTMEFIPVNMSPTIVSADQTKDFRENVYRYFGVNESVVTSRANEEEMEAFYSSRIEPFLVAFSQELTRKVFTPREISFGAFILFESSRLQFASNKTKLSLLQMVDRGAMTPNEWRATMNLAPVEGGDVPIRRLDTAPVSDKPDADPTDTTIVQEDLTDD